MKYLLAIILGLALWLSAQSYTFTVEGPQRAVSITNVEEVKVTVTAYNPGDPNQTDDTPCTGPRNVSICEEMKDKTVCAANFVPLGTILNLKHGNKYIDCIVLDRTARKYGDRVDIAMSSKEEAIEWGKKILTMQ